MKQTFILAFASVVCAYNFNLVFADLASGANNLIREVENASWFKQFYLIKPESTYVPATGNTVDSKSIVFPVRKSSQVETQLQPEVTQAPLLHHISMPVKLDMTVHTPVVKDLDAIYPLDPYYQLKIGESYPLELQECTVHQTRQHKKHIKRKMRVLLKGRKHPKKHGKRQGGTRKAQRDRHEKKIEEKEDEKREHEYREYEEKENGESDVQKCRPVYEPSPTTESLTSSTYAFNTLASEVATATASDIPQSTVTGGSLKKTYPCYVTQEGIFFRYQTPKWNRNSQLRFERDLSKCLVIPGVSNLALPGPFSTMSLYNSKSDQDSSSLDVTSISTTILSSSYSYTAPTITPKAASNDEPTENTGLPSIDLDGISPDVMDSVQICTTEYFYEDTPQAELKDLVICYDEEIGNIRMGRVDVSKEVKQDLTIDHSNQ